MVKISVGRKLTPDEYPQIVKDYQWFLNILIKEFGEKAVIWKNFTGDDLAEELGVRVDNGFPRTDPKCLMLAVLVEKHREKEHGHYSLNAEPDKVAEAFKIIAELRRVVFPDAQ